MEKKILSGIAAAQGIVEGPVKVFLPGDEAKNFPDGAIMVTTLTDPTMVMAMMKAVGIVADMGGITSHPAILSREMGIPCVVNTKEATHVLKDGMRIRIDGTLGEVYELN